MILLIVLLIISVGLNFALIFGFVRRYADEDMMEIRSREGLKVE
ncbi:MAG: hypothetical protein OEM46_04335 [Ignavibacteria bacterium]|nr:hypothetical protein [Ignavibacteria bacterium]